MVSSETQQNLQTAMHGEAFAHLKYRLFAQQARKEGMTDVAELFDRTAQVEAFEHFSEEAELAGLVGNTFQNLQNAVAGESDEATTMYPEFAAQAGAAGDRAAADRFAEIGRDEMRHRDAFQVALEEMTAKTG